MLKRKWIENNPLYLTDSEYPNLFYPLKNNEDF
jgi:hypothetical protein